MSDKPYVIFRYKPNGDPIREEKTEDQLTESDLNLFYGNIVLAYERAPLAIQERFKKYLELEHLSVKTFTEELIKKLGE